MAHQNFTHQASPVPCACKLPTPEFIRRKRTVIADLKTHILESKETDGGFMYRFEGSDTIIDNLVRFIKTERECCDFFTFTLSLAKATESIWLELSGPAGSKDFIRAELEL